VLESSSHGFALHRLDAVRYRVGVWTNLSPEHLDLHGTLEAYREAKLTLVRRADVAVLNADEPDFEAFAAAARRVVSYGVGDRADLRIDDLREVPGGLRLSLARGDERVQLRLPMIGRYNAHNAAAALAAAAEAGVPLTHGASRLAAFPGVPGRMELVQATPFAVVVDFAHTPAALAKALRAARDPGGGRLIVVLGAAGERDPGKRAPLGRVAASLADVVVLTEEDSRSESVEAILDAMQLGASEAGAVPGDTLRRVPDRREAIAHAVALADHGDVVLLAGKGHERTLERADEVLTWDEAAEARRVLGS
jgi:UDP-N-acetylmuramoyl-L-alanyl-D-glutamate--2,6-diaminopimelate ligase